MLRRNDAAASRLDMTQSFRESRQGTRAPSTTEPRATASRASSNTDAGTERVSGSTSSDRDPTRGGSRDGGEEESAMDGVDSGILSESGESGDSEASAGVYVPRDTHTIMAASECCALASSEVLSGL